MADQDKNFGIVWSWVDLVAKTREIFVGTDKERAMHAKHSERAEIAKAGAALRAQRRSPLRKLLQRRFGASLDREVGSAPGPSRGL